MQPRP